MGASSAAGGVSGWGENDDRFVERDRDLSGRPGDADGRFDLRALDADVDRRRRGLRDVLLALPHS